jgi:hypothetical protein
MRWFGRRRDRRHEEAERQAVAELLDGDHHRASVRGGDQVMVNAGKVLENVALAMERVDLDINTEISIEEDVARFEELVTLVDTLRCGPTLAVHVVNTAMRIMSARYPAELVGRPLPPEYDLRKLTPLQIDTQHQEIAKKIFNRRTASAADLTEDDVIGDFHALDPPDQIQVFIVLFSMYGHKVGAMKYTTGIE